MSSLDYLLQNVTLNGSSQSEHFSQGLVMFQHVQTKSEKGCCIQLDSRLVFIPNSVLIQTKNSAKFSRKHLWVLIRNASNKYQGIYRSSMIGT